MTRQEANAAIIRLLLDTIQLQPDIRFGQLLRNLNVVDEVRNEEGMPTGWREEFYLESDVLLARMLDAIRRNGV